jgi:fibronectin type 3 domain-containing protein
MDQNTNIYELHGTVRGRNSTPLGGARVVVWRQQIRGRQQLVAGDADNNGAYQLRYEIPENTPLPLLLVVEALSEYLDAPLFSALTEARPSLEIDLDLEPPDQSEWTTLTGSITPLLDGLRLSDLVETSTHQDLSFLARESSNSTESLMRVALSARLEAAFQLPAPVFYAFLRQRVPAGLPTPLLDASQNFTLIGSLLQTVASMIFRLSPQIQTQTLTAAIALNRIGARFTTQISGHVAQMQVLRSADMLSQSFIFGNATLAQLLDVAGLPPAKHQTFAQALATNSQPMPDFWSMLGDGRHGFTAEEASAMELTLTVGSFVKNFVPLVQKITEGFAAATYKTVEDLARLRKQDWVNMVNQTGPPPGIDAAGSVSAAEYFASDLYTRATRSFPTAALSASITAGTFLPVAERQPLVQFFQNHPTLDLIKENIPAYLASRGEKAFAGIGPQDRAAVITQARKFQRVLRIAPDPEVARTLLDLGIHSATQIAAMGKQQFFLKATTAGLTSSETNHAFQASAQRYAGVVSLYMQLNRDPIGVLPRAIGQLSDLDIPVQQAIQQDPSLATLFGSQDYCATDDCTSILSPAAYLCDLLVWLSKHPQGTQTALDVLDSRRPDIRHLLLNCPNTDTELPYIDLVNELLADKISPPIDAISSSYTQSALINGVTYYYIITAVNSAGEGAPSAQISAAPALPPTAAPSMPTGVTATPGDTQQIVISWNAVSGATGYNIYWSTAAPLTPATGTRITGAASGHIQTGLANGTTYYYIVTATNAAGESAPSPELPAIPSAPVAPPASPAGAAATSLNSQAAITWNTVPGAGSYNVYWSNSSGVTTTSGTRIASAATPYFQTGLINGKAYYYIVTAVNSFGESAPSVQVSATPTATPSAAAAPSGVSGTPGNTTITIAWNAVPGATSYNIYWSTSAGVTTMNGTEIAGAWNPQWKQTPANMTTAELSAAPAYFNQGAFAILFGASYPFTLPYCAGLDGLRTYLQQLNLPVWQIRQALLPLNGATSTQECAVAAERFGMTPHGADLVTKPNFVAAPTAWNTANPQVDLASVPAFLQAASLSYESLIELLQAAWVQGGLNVSIQGIDDTCMTSNQTLTPSPLDAGFLDRAHRFLRLWLSAGYKMWELDLLMTAPAVANSTLDQNALAALLAFRQLQDATGLTVSQQLAFYQNIDIATHRDPDGSTTASLYAQIFLNAAVSSVARDPDLAAIPLGGTIINPLLTAHLAGIQAALGLSASDAALLFNLTNGQLTLGSLSLIYRISGLATASKFSISNLIVIAGLLNPSAAGSAVALASLLQSPSATLNFLQQATVIQQSRLTPDALVYLLTPPTASISGGWATTTQMTQANIATTLAAVQEAAGSFTAMTTLAAPITTTTQTSITVVGIAGFPAPNFSIAIGTEILLVTAMSGAGSTTWTVVRGQEGTVAAAAAAGAIVAPPGSDLNGSVIAAVAANAHTASTAGLFNDVSAFILQTLVVPGTGTTLLAVLTDPAFTASGNPLTPSNFPAQFLAIQLFDKVGVLVRTFGFRAADLSWLVTDDNFYGGLDFTQLPVLTSQPAVNLSLLLTTLLLIKLARMWTAALPSSSVQTLYNVIGGVKSGTLANAAAAQSALATITGWPAGDIALFSAALGLAYPADYLRPAAYDALRTLEAMATATSATAAQIVSWGTTPPDEPTAESMANGALGVLKAQQTGNDAWLALAPTLMNPLRENRSAALRAYLIAQRDSSGESIYGDVNGLFNYFLIDVQMSSCQVTSRVVQAYIAVQTFVERCMMNLEAPEIVVDLATDDTWSQWEWMSRYRIWEANREVFLYPENWLIESQRPNRTETYQTFEQEVRQGQSTTDYLETVVLNYVDRLDGLAHLLITGTCTLDSTNYVVARTVADPPVFYIRSSYNGAWTGWSQIPFNINAHHVIPGLYRNRVCLFWLDVKVSNEPTQTLPAAQVNPDPPPQAVDRYVTLGVNFSVFRNGSWAPPQASKAKLFDRPIFDVAQANDPKIVEALYTLKLSGDASAGPGNILNIDVYRQPYWDPVGNSLIDNEAVHIGRAVFDGRFSDLELSDLTVRTLIDDSGTTSYGLFTWAQQHYGLDAQPLLLLDTPNPLYTGDMGLIPQAGALTTPAVANMLPNALQPGGTLPLAFASVDLSPILNTAQVPFRVVVPVTYQEFHGDEGSFFFQDSRRCYWVETETIYSSTGTTGVQGSYRPTQGTAYQIGYIFHPFYYAFTRLFWNQLESGGFDLLYDPNLQQAPDSIDPGSSDVFSFQNNYQPNAATQVHWDLADVSTTLASPITSTTQTAITVTNNIWISSPAFYVTIGSEAMQVTAVGGPGNTTWTVVRAQQGTTAAVAAGGATVMPVAASQDRQFLDFSTTGSYSVYNWELFYHIPLYIAQLLSQNQQFEDAQTWFHYIFNPSRQSTDPVPQRFWIPKPFHNLTSAEILAQQINNLLIAVNEGDAAAVQQIETWRNDPFNPFVLADTRPVAYMKSTVMSYLDNLIAWGDNLFASESREALGEATLLYVVASEVLGPAPVAVTPPQHADQSFDQLQPALDAFANAMVEIENVIGPTSVSGTGGGTGGIPAPETFYFKIPSNAKLLGYWDTIADRLYKLRHCQSISGAPLQLALFDAPIDPGLLTAAQAAGVDLSSVLSNLGASLPNYRFTFLYPQALDFVNAVRAYGALLLSALEKSDGDQLALLIATNQKQLLDDADQIFDWQLQQAQNTIAALNANLDLGNQRLTYYTNEQNNVMNAEETAALALSSTSLALNSSIAIVESIAAGTYLLPFFSFGIKGFGGTPSADTKTPNVGDSVRTGAAATKAIADALDKGAALLNAQGKFSHTSDDLAEKVTEANMDIAHTNLQIAGAQLGMQIAAQNQTNHQTQADQLQKQIDFLTSKFTNEALYDWMAGQLSATYFQRYQLAYQMCKQVERCYQFELGIQNSSFIQFGYWDSLHKGLLAGETLNHDLRRMQSSYLQQNARRYELSRFVSLGTVNPAWLQQLLVTGACDFSLTESLFDNDYPGHYNRRLTRVSVTVVYPGPGKFDNVRATLTLVANRVRVGTDTTAGYAENPVGSDPRFLYNYAAVPQKIALGNGQDDPGLFVTAITGNIADQRYVPFENAGAISSWHLEMPQANNDVDLSTVGDVVIHLFYTALDGGAAFQQAAEANNAAGLPTSGIKLFSAQNDFAAASPTVDVPYPLTPWQAFLSTQKVIVGALPLQQDGAPRWQAFDNPPAAVAGVNTDQVLTLSISPLKFPTWTRGKTITVTSLTVIAVAWEPGSFLIAPQAPLPIASLTMAPVAGVTEPNVCAATITMPPNTPLGTWSFKLQQQGAANFQSLNKNLIGDVLLLVNYDAS